jgi:hypothetical protein
MALRLATVPASRLRRAPGSGMICIITGKFSFAINLSAGLSDSDGCQVKFAGDWSRTETWCDGHPSPSLALHHWHHDAAAMALSAASAIGLLLPWTWTQLTGGRWPWRPAAGGPGARPVDSEIVLNHHCCQWLNPWIMFTSKRIAL